MSDLFKKTEINNMTLKNRFVRSATWEGLAGKDGSCTPQLTDMMVKLAEGGAGLIITGYAFVQSAGQAGPFQLGIHNDNLIPGFRSMTEAVHKSNGTIALQLAHAGCQASLKLTGQDRHRYFTIIHILPSDFRITRSTPRQFCNIISPKCM